MNRRQKMKRMKQKLEWYKKQMVPVREVRYDSRQMRVETLRAERYMDADGCRYIPSDVIFNHIIDDMKPELRKFMHYETEGPFQNSDYYRYAVELKVVVPER